MSLIKANAKNQRDNTILNGYQRWPTGIRDILDVPQGEHGWQISSIPVSIVESEEKISYGGLVKHFDRYLDDLKCV